MADSFINLYTIMPQKNNIKVYFLLSLFFFIYIDYLFKINLSCWTYSFQHVLVKDHVNGMLHNRDFSLFGYLFCVFPCMGNSFWVSF